VAFAFLSAAVEGRLNRGLIRDLAAETARLTAMILRIAISTRAFVATFTGTGAPISC
jgi:TRAP-type mannitol/chloroaromatic compound transport system permease large subunit